MKMFLTPEESFCDYMYMIRHGCPLIGLKFIVSKAEMQDKEDMTKEERARPRFKQTEGMCNIQAGKAHLLWSSKQNEAKQHILQKLHVDKNSCVVIMDWAMIHE